MSIPMQEFTEVSRVPMHVVSGCLVASIQVDLDDYVLKQFQTDLLDRIRETRARGVVLDVSGVAVIDPHDFEMLRRTILMAQVMGARSILVGLQAGVVSSLIEMDTDISDIQAAAQLEDALVLLQSNDAPAELENTTVNGTEEKLPYYSNNVPDCNTQ